MKRDNLDELVRKYLACKKLSVSDEITARREYARRDGMNRDAGILHKRASA